MFDISQEFNPDHPFYRALADDFLTLNWQVQNLCLHDLCGIHAPKHRLEREAETGILAAALKRSLEGGNGFVCYSRRATAYTGMARYSGEAYTRTYVLRGIKRLVDLGILEHQLAPAGTRGNWQSRFRLRLDKLTPGLEASLTYHPSEIILLRDHDRRLIGYQDDASTRQMRAELSMLNFAFAEVEINTDHPLIRHSGPMLFVPNKDGGYNVLSRSRNSLCRIFCHNSWRLGGRCYQAWWQSIPRAMRETINIDGLPTIEHDYAQLHARLLYAVAGAHLKGDAYTLDDWPRSLGKVAFQILINAGTLYKAVGALARVISEREPSIRPEIAKARASDLVWAMRARHKEIARYFHSGAGVWLQRLDSDMAIQTMLWLHRKGVLALSVHDSFIVQQQHGALLLEAMDGAFTMACRQMQAV